MGETKSKDFFPLIGIFCVSVTMIFCATGWSHLNSIWVLLRDQL
jgi:hypothetical protein